MASTPTPAATKAMGKIFMLLIAHFDVEKGAYAKGWSDQKIATETGMSLDTVTDLRRETFGEIKEPAEVATLREDIRSLEALLTEQIAAMRSRLADISKRWAA